MYDNKSVLVIGQDGKKLGVMSITQAKEKAFQEGLDLVEVNSKNRVYKILDKGKWEYQQNKKKKSQKQNKHIQKEIKFRPVTEVHDMNTKIGQIKKFLDKQYSVKLTVYLKGREKKQPEIAKQKLLEIYSLLENVSLMSDIKSYDSLSFAIIQPRRERKEDGDSGSVFESRKEE